MDTAVLSCSSKTFLLGEYLALKGGPALVAATAPHFELQVQKKRVGQENQENPFHVLSPAGKYWEEGRDLFQRFEMKFLDPYKGKGGLGASSAQFGLLAAVVQLQNCLFEHGEKHLDFKQILKEYRQYGNSGGVFPPSGADLMGQLCGNLTWFNRNSGRVEIYSWIWDEIGFGVFATGEKVATHEHLSQLQEFDSERLEEIMVRTQKSLVERSSSNFIGVIDEYRNELFKEGREAPSTTQILEKLRLNFTHGQDLASKGCGALGADMILVVYKKSIVSIERIQKVIGLPIMATENSLESGFKHRVV